VTAESPTEGGLSQEARLTYSTIAKEGSALVDSDLPAVHELADLGLIHLSPDGERFVPVDPRQVELELSGELRQQVWRLQVRASALERDITDLTAEYLESQGEEHGSVRYIEGLQAIAAFIEQVSRDAHEEIVTAQPGGGRPAEVLEAALPLAIEQLGRGVRLRTLYQHSARFSEATKQYVREVVQHGAEVRTLEEFFDRMFIIDRSMAIIAGNASRTAAAVITDQAVVAFLADLFDRSWQRALEFRPTRAALSSSEVVPEIHTMIKRLLIEGLTDSAIAKRIGVSERTYHSHLAKIRKELGAESRLQLGYLLAREELCADNEGRAPSTAEETGF
jgi:DNA-binding NarL/FixJ family response regulator